MDDQPADPAVVHEIEGLDEHHGQPVGQKTGIVFILQPAGDVLGRIGSPQPGDQRGGVEVFVADEYRQIVGQPRLVAGQDGGVRQRQRLLQSIVGVGPQSSALLASACEADIIALVLNADAPWSPFSPGFTGPMNRPVIGLVTKADLANPQRISLVESWLVQAGAQKVFVTSALENTGVDEMFIFLNAKEPSCLTK